MSSFYYNNYSNEGCLSQWKKYIQNKSYFDEIVNSINYNGATNQSLLSYQSKIIEKSFVEQTKKINDNLNLLTQNQINAIKLCNEEIIGKIEVGFETIHEDLSDISNLIFNNNIKLDNILSSLDWNFSKIIEQQRLSNMMLLNVAELLKIPEIQKQRQYHTINGIKFLSNARIDEELYDDALNSFKKAEILEPTDSFVLFNIGFIYLFSDSKINVEKAEEYFKKAIKYKTVDFNSFGLRENNYLNSNINSDITNQNGNASSIKNFLIKSYLFAIKSCYIQGKFNDAVELCNKSLEIDNNLNEIKFLKAKSLLALNEYKISLSILEEIIEVDNFFLLQIINDFDFITKNETSTFLKKLNQKKLNILQKLLAECKKNISKNSIVEKELSDIERQSNIHNFFNLQKLINRIKKKKIIGFSNPFNTSLEDKNFNTEINLNFLKKEILEISNQLKFPNKNITKIMLLYNNLGINTQWNFPKINSFKDCLNFDNSFKAKQINSNLYNFIKIEKVYHDSYNGEKEKVIKFFQEILIEDKEYYDKLVTDKVGKNLNKIEPLIETAEKQENQISEKENILIKIIRLFK